MLPNGDLNSNPGMCPDQESNQQPFGSQAGAQSTEPHRPVFIAALFMVTKTLRQPKCPLIEEWIKKTWSMCTMDFYSAIRKNEMLPFATTWMDLEHITLSTMSVRKSQEPYNFTLM